MTYTEDDYRAMALLAADELVEAAREGNRLLRQESGAPSRTSPADYMEARDTIEKTLLDLVDLKPR